jgi:hypothetical protein
LNLPVKKDLVTGEPSRNVYSAPGSEPRLWI